MLPYHELSQEDKDIVFVLSKNLEIVAMNKNCENEYLRGWLSNKYYLSYCNDNNIEPIIKNFTLKDTYNIFRVINDILYSFDVQPWGNSSLAIVGTKKTKKPADSEEIRAEIQKTLGCRLDVASSNKDLLKKLMHFYNSLLFNMPANVYWLNKDCVMLGCNKNLLDFLGLESIEDFIGKTYSELSNFAGWGEGVADSFMNDDMHVIKTGKSILSKKEPPLKLRNGKFAYYISNRVPIRDDTGNIIGVLGVSVDITELEASRELTEKSLEDARAANSERKKMLARLTQFVDDQEHDIRTPLGGVAGSLEYIIPMVKTDPDEAMSVLEMINQSANEILEYQESLLHDLYEGDREGRSIFSRFNIADITKRVFKANEAAAMKKKLEYTLHYDEAIPSYLLGDGKKVYQCLLDLLGNALRFTSTGSVSLSVEYLGQSHRDAVVRFSVSDTGRGIPTDRQRDILEAYVKVDPSNRGGDRGRGLGLTRVCQYAHEVGGELRIDSEMGKGSCFKLVLPFKTSLDQTNSN